MRSASSTSARQWHVAPGDRHFAGFQAAEFQDVVDQAQHVPTRIGNRLGAVGQSLRRAGAPGDQVGIADHRVERRSQLVRQAREELAFCPIGSKQPAMRFVQPIDGEAIDAGGFLCRAARTAQLDRLHGQGGKVGQDCNLARVRSCPRHPVKHAQSADRLPIGCSEPHAGIEGEMRRPDDERVALKARIGAGIRYHHGDAVGTHGVAAERMLAGHFRRVKPYPSLEPDPPLVHQRDQADRCGQQHHGGVDQVLEAILGRRVEDAICSQRGKAERFVGSRLGVGPHGIPSLIVFDRGQKAGRAKHTMNS